MWEFSVRQPDAKKKKSHYRGYNGPLIWNAKCFLANFTLKKIFTAIIPALIHYVHEPRFIIYIGKKSWHNTKQKWHKKHLQCIFH